ncbi:PIN domain-containing protein [Enterobacteriaceae bacterium C34A]
MSEQLIGRLVFIDTSAYEAKNFQFSAYQLKKIREYCEADKLWLLTTDITIAEIKSHIRKKAVMTADLLKEAKSDLRLIRNLPDVKTYGIFQETLTSEIIAERIISDFDDFISAKNVENVSLDKASASLIFDDYFSSKPPFSERKKDEFPDAFVLHAIKKISIERMYPLYVVSSDGDMKSFCEGNGLFHLSRVDDLIDLLNRNEDELKEPMKLLDSVFEENLCEVNRAVLDSLLEAAYSIDFMPEVAGIEVEDIDFSITNKFFVDISIEDDYTISAETEVEVLLTLNARVFENDYGRSVWDSEEEKYIYVFKNETIIKFSQVVTVPLRIAVFEGVKARTDIVAWDQDNFSITLNNRNGTIMEYIEHSL